MTDKEFETIALAIKAAYPNSNVLPDKYAMKTWFELLQDLDYNVAQNAVMEHISTSVFPPSIAEIRNKCAVRTAPIISDWGEAWEEVLYAIRKYGSYREEEAVASLSKITARVTKRLGFRNLCLSENQMADRAHFQRMYESMVREEQKNLQLPAFARDTRKKMIESNRSEKIEIGKNRTEEKQDNYTPAEYVDDLMKKFRKTMGVATDGKDEKRNVSGV